MNSCRKSILCSPCWPTRAQLQILNNIEFADGEWRRFVENYLDKPSDGIIDKFDTLTHSISQGLPREIALRQKQYEYYRDLLLHCPQFPSPGGVAGEA